MIIKSKFQDLLCEFIHRWECPNCTASNRVGVRSPLTQSAIRRCRSCGSEYDIQLDMEGVQAHKKELAKKFGAKILGSLIPGY